MDPSVSSSENFVAVPGGRVFVKTWTPPTSHGAPLLLLHDSLGCVEIWRDFPSLLSAHLQRTVIAYDRLGFGQSSARSELPSLNFIKEEATVYLPHLLTALQINQFSLFGHSVGGAMAIGGSGHFGSRCESVITESAQAFVEEKTRQGILQAKADFENPLVFKKLEKYHGSKAQWVLDAWTKVWLSDGFSSWSLKEDIAKVSCPALVIHGENDEYGSLSFPETICQLAGERAEKHIIANCGHVPHREKPDLILDLIVNFLSAGH